jgi:hypothetical protein
MLIGAAKNLGIPSDSKTIDQISEEISLKAKLSGAE